MLIDDDLIKDALKVARRNWEEWSAEFEDGQRLLAAPARFDVFVKEYSVGRTIKAGTKTQFRERLATTLAEAIRDDSGRGLDALELKLRSEFGTFGGTRRMTSVLSKVAAFIRPDRFVAWDSYARKGLQMVLGKKSPFQTYAEYLRAFDSAWHSEPGKKITEYLERDDHLKAVEREGRFQRRVLDVCLMMVGNRKKFYKPE